MAKKQIKQKVFLKKKEKKWYPIIAPPFLGGQEVGQTFVSNIQKSIGKTVSLNAANLFGDARKQSVKLTLKIKEVKEEKALTEIVSYTIFPIHIRRMVRTERSKIDDSFTAETKEKIKTQVKTFAITKNKTSNSIKTKIRKQTQKRIIEKSKELDFQEIIEILLSTKLQKEIRESLNKITPLSSFEVRHFSRL